MLWQESTVLLVSVRQDQFKEEAAGKGRGCHYSKIQFSHLIQLLYSKTNASVDLYSAC